MRRRDDGSSIVTGVSGSAGASGRRPATGVHRAILRAHAWSDSWPMLLAILAQVLIAAGLHAWLSTANPIEDDNDALRLTMTTLAADFALALGVLVVGWQGWVLERRRRELAEELERARRELGRQAELERERQRLALLGTLAAGLAHELGQPLSAARVGIEGIHYLRQLGREPDPAHLERTLSRVGMSLVAMTQTIDHLRSLAAPEALESRPLDLVGLVSAVLADRANWLRFSGVAIDWQAPTSPVPVLGDAAGIRLILTNLLRNAVEAVMTRSESQRQVRLTVGPGPVLAVHDSGPGISAENLAHIFDPFHSTKGGVGRGIGLSLALASARRMGAELEVDSHLGSGSVFILRMLAVP
jgi:signal transduction histidine kinase